jgi:hypothetical protein
LNELDILKDVSIKLEKVYIDFMLSGSLFMSYYAQPIMTRDLDIVIRLNKVSSETLYDLFCNDYYISKEAVVDAVRNESMFNHPLSLINSFVISTG